MNDIPTNMTITLQPAPVEKPSSSPYGYGISRRIDRKSGVWTFYVTVVRRGVVVTKQFSETRNGGHDGALAQAIAFRDQVLAELPPYSQREYRAILRRSNSSGMTGVLRYSKAGYLVWEANAQFPNGKSKSRCFSINKYGEEQARALMLQQIDGYYLTTEEAKLLTEEAQPALCTPVAGVPLVVPAKPRKFRKIQKCKPLSGCPGVTWERGVNRNTAGEVTAERHYWVARYTVRGVRKMRCFRIEPGKEEEALRLAVAQREAWEAEFGPP